MSLKRHLQSYHFLHYLKLNPGHGERLIKTHHLSEKATDAQEVGSERAEVECNSDISTAPQSRRGESMVIKHDTSSDSDVIDPMKVEMSSSDPINAFSNFEEASFAPQDYLLDQPHCTWYEGAGSLNDASGGEIKLIKCLLCVAKSIYPEDAIQGPKVPLLATLHETTWKRHLQTYHFLHHLKLNSEDNERLKTHCTLEKAESQTALEEAVVKCFTNCNDNAVCIEMKKTAASSPVQEEYNCEPLEVDDWEEDDDDMAFMRKTGYSQDEHEPEKVGQIEDISQLQHLWCICHLLHLVVIDVFYAEQVDPLTKLVAKCRWAAQTLRRSNKVCISLELMIFTVKLWHIYTLCILRWHSHISEPSLPLRPKLDVRTRWSSLLAMLKSISCQTNEITRAALLAQDSKEIKALAELPQFTAEEIQTLEEVIQLLEPFASMTEQMTKQAYPTLCDVRMAYATLLHSVVQVKVTTCITESLQLRLKKGLEERLKPVVTKPVYLAASFLKPGDVAGSTLRAADVSTLIKFFSDLIEWLGLSNNCGSMSSLGSDHHSAEMVMNCFFSEEDIPSCANSIEAEIALHRTPSVRKSTLAGQPLQYWKEAVDLPLLQACARVILALPASSIPRSQLFCTRNQNPMSPSTISQIMFLKCNL
ncbi:hypothetical protein Ciccas_001029 [Cichlidogyrus casuarinus]|uniref:HAT C-terminal dimerisation domain-containing protein n=1 Tax=Cichlidogyrus casuarinus TaxID=1844966 RepID=A0ABD2QLH2_9PLAT